MDKQIGLEPSPEDYVAALVQVFRDVRRVLREDGTLWIVIGDSYSSGGRTTQCAATLGGMHETRPVRPPVSATIKPKDLIGIPWMLAFALRDDGWYLRADIIWNKSQCCMPESVMDRPTKAHEHILLLAKQPVYYYDADAIKEPETASSLHRYTYSALSMDGKTGTAAYRLGNGNNGNMTASGVSRTTAGLKSHEHHPQPNGRNKRSVWTVNTESYSGAHYAVMPEALVEPAVLAGAPLGGLVLDPFCGSGTVPYVAERLGRRSVGIDLAYQDLARERTAQRGLFVHLPEDAAQVVV